MEEDLGTETWRRGLSSGIIKCQEIGGRDGSGGCSWDHLEASEVAQRGTHPQR